MTHETASTAETRESCFRQNRWPLIAAIAFILTVLASTVLLKAWAWSGPAEIAIALLPVAPLMLMFGAMVRCIRKLDELEQRIQLEALAIAVIVSSLICFTVGQLQRVDAVGPTKLSEAWVVLSLAYLGAVVLVKRKYRA